MLLKEAPLLAEIYKTSDLRPLMASPCLLYRCRNLLAYCGLTEKAVYCIFILFIYESQGRNTLKGLKKDAFEKL